MRTNFNYDQSIGSRPGLTGSICAPSSSQQLGQSREQSVNNDDISRVISQEFMISDQKPSIAQRFLINKKKLESKIKAQKQKAKNQPTPKKQNDFISLFAKKIQMPEAIKAIDTPYEVQ